LTSSLPQNWQWYFRIRRTYR